MSRKNHFRVCVVCGKEKANTAFRVVGERANEGRGRAPLSPACFKCDGGYKRIRGNSHYRAFEHVDLAEARTSFAGWMQAIRATPHDSEVVALAVARYGLKNPCPDEILEAYVGGDQRRYGKLFHATVLLAHESRNAGRLGTYNLAPDRRYKNKHPGSSWERETEANVA